ncbi:DeoR/GlpR family DNA-binding transcription regulator [Paenibacillus sp. strain BS8-2]
MRRCRDWRLLRLSLCWAIPCFISLFLSIGGEMNASQKTAGGALAEQMLSQLKVDKAFISPDGISIVDGVTDYDVQEANISRLIMKRADEVILLADHSKFGIVTFSRICSLEDVSLVITDRQCPEDWKQLLGDQDVQLLLAEEDEFQ